MPRNLFGKETKIEKKVRKILNRSKKYTYRINHSIKGNFNVDFFILKPFELIIECYGDYYHANPKMYLLEQYDEIQKKNTIRDKKKMPFMKLYNYMIFWENQINERSFGKKLKKLLSEAEQIIKSGEKFQYFKL